MLTAARVFYLLCDWPATHGDLCAWLYQNREVWGRIRAAEPEAALHILDKLEKRAAAFGESA